MTRIQIMKKAASSLVGAGALAVLIALLTPAGAAEAAPVTIDLYAVSGSTTLAGQPVTVLGYNTSNTAVGQPGGPVLTVDQGDVVTVHLHNQLTERTSLLFQGQSMTPDVDGVASGGDTFYTFTANKAGTYLYEAGLIDNGQHQVAMGLYGALVVRPAVAGQAYADPTTAFDDEAVLVLSEIDPALNNSSNPAAFDMRKFHPRYFMINGKVYPDTANIPTLPGNKVLLRYVNAGINYHSMAVLGARQSVVALDGSPLNFGRRYVAETFGPGQTADAIVTVPMETGYDNKLAVYDASLLQHNSNVAGSGGMLTYLTVTGTPVAGDSVGPVTSAAGFAAGALTATVDDSTTGGSTIKAAEYYVDDVSGAAVALSAADGTFGSVSEGVTGLVPIPAGQHVLYVRGQDASNNWGAFTSVLVNGGDIVGPATSGLVVSPDPSNGSQTLTVTATGDDTLSGGSNVVAAEYTIDGGTAVAMTVNVPTTIASLDATIPAGTVGSEGTHLVTVQSQDSAGNWGDPVSVEVVVDTTGPDTAGVDVTPNPNNGTQSYSAGILAVRVTATFTDPVSGLVSSNIRKGEGFIDTVGANGSGFTFAASDGVFDSSPEVGYADIPLATIAQLSGGPHTIYVHAKDAAGNWGDTSTVVLQIDKGGPVVSAVTASPNPVTTQAQVALTADATDTTSAVTAAEWFVGADPGAGNGTAMAVTGSGPWSLAAAIDVSSWTSGNYTLKVRAKDAAGNWSSVSSTVLVVNRPLPGLLFSTLGNVSIPGLGGPFDNADIYGWDNTAFSRAFDATVAGLPGGANVDGYDMVDADHFYLSFSGNTAVPGLGIVQDEDVVYYNNGSWSVYFDGTAHGLTNNAEDVDAITVDGGTLYFSTLGNVNPPGVGGTADNADIYSWNGTSYARVWDATANGLGGAANVDGLTRVDGTHFYLSFTGNTAVPGIGVQQDEDVVYNNNGSWSVFFNGTAQGLTAGGQDVDAFDIP
jgi:FtsP/CotA-like multicopper oxidase with cupredoxin domain